MHRVSSRCMVCLVTMAAETTAARNGEPDTALARLFRVCCAPASCANQQPKSGCVVERALDAIIRGGGGGTELEEEEFFRLVNTRALPDRDGAVAKPLITTPHKWAAVVAGLHAPVVGATPLWMACAVGNVRAVGALLAAGGDRLDVASGPEERVVPARPPTASITPLWAACAGGWADVVQLLLKHSATARRLIDVVCPLQPPHVHPVDPWHMDSVPQYRRTPLGAPLVAALRRGHAGVVRVLLASGCDVERTLQFGVLNRFTPLSLACAWQFEDGVRALLQAGADATGGVEVPQNVLLDSTFRCPVILAARACVRARVSGVCVCVGVCVCGVCACVSSPA